MGFGWSLYGFFMAALAGLALYFLWAWRAARQDRADEQARQSSAQPEDGGDRHERGR